VSAVLKVGEPSARYLVADAAPVAPLVRQFDLMATAPGGVARLRELILTLAVRGKLELQDRADEPASVLIMTIGAMKAQAGAVLTNRDEDFDNSTPAEELPFQLPAGWAWSRFGDYVLELCTGPFGSLIHKDDYVDEGVPLINPSHMRGGRIVHDSSVSVTQAMAAKLGAYRLTAGDVLLARREGGYQAQR